MKSKQAMLAVCMSLAVMYDSGRAASTQTYDAFDSILATLRTQTVGSQTPPTADFALSATVPVTVAAHRGPLDRRIHKNTEQLVTNTITNRSMPGWLVPRSSVYGLPDNSIPPTPP